jgi:magnesium-transporting ATPase (P-type)
MKYESNNTSEDALEYRSWNILFYISGTIAFCFFIAVVTFYWHAGNIKDGLGYPYDRDNRFPGLRFHEVIASLLFFAWFLALLITLILTPFSLFRKRKVSWKALLFCIASQASLFVYFKYSTFLDWIIT